MAELLGPLIGGLTGESTVNIHSELTLEDWSNDSLIIRDFLVVHGKTLGGAVKVFGYWTGENPVTVNVSPVGGGTPVSRTFSGGGTLLSVPDIVDTIGLDARSLTLGLDHISSSTDSPMDMVYGHNVRVARVEMHRGLFDPATWNLVATPEVMFSGRVDGASVDDAAAESEGGLNLEVIPSSIDLTRTNPAMQSDAQQRLRSGDRFRRWGDTAGVKTEIWWGQAKDNNS